MRWLPLVLGGCGPTIVGWWDLDRWQVERDGEALERRDAGFLLWEDEAYGTFSMVLRYDYDPAAFDLVPRATTEVHHPAYDPDDFDPDEPIVFGYTVDNLVLSLEVVSYGASEMQLETASPFADGATWTWTLLR
ncbi:MAG: hypothetical protein ABMA64_11785 [Myxococcota bacterium]